MVLGYVDPNPAGEIQVWYSSEGEVLRTQNGRLVGTAGLETNWSAVRTTALPTWMDVFAQPTLEYARERDETPGYRFGIAERVTIYPVPIPKNAKLSGVAATNLRWFEEAVIGQPDGLPSARYGVQDREGQPPQVIYGEQCLSKDLCIAWQTWPAS
jgi:hypothetical protein